VIITRTPYRVSFLGGGTDYPAWFRAHGGAVLATAIDKFCTITCRRLPPFFAHRSRIVYSRVEEVAANDRIEHPAVRAALGFLGIEDGVEIHHDGDLPARAGIGSSSSFTVGLLHALRAFRGLAAEPGRLAREAITVEQDVIGENVGCQDQVTAAFGGFNRIAFHRDGGFDVRPLVLDPERRRALDDHLMLFFTGQTRIASEVARDVLANVERNVPHLDRMRAMVDEGIAILEGDGALDAFGALLDESWRRKRALASRVSTPLVDEVLAEAKAAGATGGKLLGAGGGGFVLLFAPPAVQTAVRARLRKLLEVPFTFEERGAELVASG
jgi:D-glycero-alpha-D-manno-heptose-7-phosphate kinase